MSIIIFFSASKQIFLAEMMCKQLIFCVNAAIRLPMSVMLLFIDFKNKKNICTRQKPKVYRKFNASTDIVITFQTLFLKSYFQDDNNNKLSLRLNYVPSQNSSLHRPLINF